jgi:hypothetical protein
VTWPPKNTKAARRDPAASEKPKPNCSNTDFILPRDWSQADREAFGAFLVREIAAEPDHGWARRLWRLLVAVVNLRPPWIVERMERAKGLH